MQPRITLVMALLLAACGAAGPAPSPSATETEAPPVMPSATNAPAAIPTITPRPTPTAIVDWSCPTASPITVIEYARASSYCFEDRDAVVRGFVGGPPAIGWEPPFVVRPWRWPAEGWVLWQRGPGGDAMCGGGDDCAWLELNILLGATFDFSHAPGWAVVTGHRFDPAAETCSWDDGYEGVLPPVEQARAECRTEFVLTSIAFE
jgi:hypothetical protein